MKRNLVLIISVVIAVLVMTSGIVFAKADKNPNFPTRAEVEKMIIDANQNFQGQIDGLQNQINGFNSQITALDTKVNNLEAYFQGKIDELSQRIALLETAVTSNTQDIAAINTRIDELENNIPALDPEPPFNIDIIANDSGTYIAGKSIRITGIASTSQQRIPNPWYPSPNWHEPLARVQFWGILHTPDGDVNSQVRYEGNELGIMIFQTANEYHDMILTADIYAFYGGKTAKQSLDIVVH